MYKSKKKGMKKVMVKEDEKLIIEDGVTVLEPLTFVDCQAKEIIMPDSVETI